MTVVTCNSEFASCVQIIGVAYGVAYSSSWSYLCYMTLSVARILCFRLMYFFMHWHLSWITANTFLISPHNNYKFHRNAYFVHAMIDVMYLIYTHLIILILGYNSTGFYVTYFSTSRMQVMLRSQRQYLAIAVI